MPSKRLAVFVASFSVILGSLTITTPLFAATSETVLYSFCSTSGCADGGFLLAALSSTPRVTCTAQLMPAAQGKDAQTRVLAAAQSSS
jgi:hypothetical protein